MIRTEIRIEGAPVIAGLRFRMFDPDRDAAAFVDLVIEANVADDVDYIPTVEQLRSDDAHAGRRSRTGVAYRKDFVAD
jgi:hypothetical protein